MEIDLLGGFDVRHADHAAAGFESQKVRALLAYLVVHEGRALSRDQVAGLLWPEVDGSAARRNLRQALYNLRQSLPELVDSLVTDHWTVSFHARTDDRVDVIEFLAAVRRGLPGPGEVVVGPLRRAIELYRGELLAGFFVHDSVEFEEWLGAEQGRLREAVLRALGSLIEHLAARGEYEEAVAHARRRVEVDPLSEESHRELMRLYVLAGRRRRALAQFDELSDVLARELGVEPLAETRHLHQRILAEDLTLTATAADSERPSLGLFVPLVGREGELAALDASWRQTIEGGARLALIEGRAGVGKTRLIKSFLSRVSSEHAARVVQARCLEGLPTLDGQPFVDLLHAVDGLDRGDAKESAGDEATSPAGGGQRPPITPPGAGTEDGERVASSLLAALQRRGTRPLVIFLDDLQWASDGTWQALARIADDCLQLPLWLVAATDRIPHGTGARALAAHPRVDRVRLEALDDSALSRIAAALVGDGEDASRLATALAADHGLPLAVVERLNSLRDEGYLTSSGPLGWTLEGDPSSSPTAGLELDQVIAHRLSRLPNSTRRLLAVAAVIGQTFDLELLQRAAHEHMAVVEIGIELLLERWLVRQHVPRWSDSPRQRDLVLWAQGARRGSFEFAHARLRQVALGALPAARRRVLHGEIADALAARAADGFDVAPELLAHHRREAGDAAEDLPPDQKRKRAPR